MVDVAHGLVVADTDVVIDFLRGGEPGASALRGPLSEDRLRFTAVTAFELRVGTDFLDRRRDIVSLLAGRTLPLDALAAIRGGEVYARLRQAGEEIGIKDSLQAGICLRYELELLTRNIAHFRRVLGLRLAPVDKP